MRLPFAFILAVSFPLCAAGETNAPPPASGRDFYNAGTRLLKDKKFADAERMFQAALGAQDDQIQPLALFNVGDTRFEAGLDRLKQGPDAQKASAQGEAALMAGRHALSQGESALAANDLDRMVSAYLEGRGARRQLRAAEKAVAAAMETYGKTLEQWLRAADDFKSAVELNPADTNAAHNAAIVQKGIAQLVDSLRNMQGLAGMMNMQGQDLGKMMGKLKGAMPGQNAPPGPAGEGDEDDEGTKPDSLAGQKEDAGRQGDEMRLTLSPDQASQILNGLSLDGTRRLDMSDKEGKPSANKNGRNW
jgi:tetratricopeptide (TPR) repeat protein